jgi:methionine-rich copper-binding protein CopC
MQMTGKRVLVATILGSAALAVATPAALAHTDIRASTPKSGATVKALPATVTVTFESVVLRVRSATLTGPDGKNHAASFRIDPKNRARVLVATKNPKAGRYRLSLTITGADADTVKRGLSFRVSG